MTVFLARVLLGAVFIAAATAKLTDRGGVRRAVVGFGVPNSVAAPLGWTLLGAELGTGCLLLVEPAAQVGGVAALVLLAGFSAAVLVSLARGQRPYCHCFGRLSSTPIGWPTLARNGCLASLAASVALGGRFGWAVLAVASLLLGLWLGSALHRRWTSRAGAGAVDFAMVDQGGQNRTLDALLKPRRPLLLIFSQPGCSACDALLPDIARWQDQLQGRITVAVVSGGRVDNHVSEYGLSTVLVDERRTSFAAYGITATPSAVLVDVDRRRSAPARGSRAIADLLGQAQQASAEPRFTRRHALGRAAAGIASVTVLPAVASACSPGRSGASPDVDALEVDGVWLCNQTYALCTTAPCVPSTTDPDIAVCDCVVLNGYSMGFKTCDERAPSGTRLVSTFSTDNVNAHFGVMTCPSGVPWANCLDMECEIDPTNPAQAHCYCTTVKTGESKTFGGGCDTATCATTIWSGATPDLPGTDQYRKGMEQLGQRVNFPATCPPSPITTTTPAR
jgi:hypothetical protein